MSRVDRITKVLEAQFHPSSLSVSDDSSSHAGHNPEAAGGGTHLTVRIISEAFQGMTRIMRHRAVYALLNEEMASGLHAVSLHTLTPEESENS